MKFVFYNQCELCVDTITDILEFERIPYRLENRRVSMFGQVLYDITIDTSFEHWLFVQKIAIDKLTPYMRAEKSYMLPSYHNETKTPNTDVPMPLFLLEKDYDYEIVIRKHKKSLLKKFIDKIKEIL